MAVKLWTEEMHQQLRDLWPTKPARECAAIMGLSAKAVKTRAAKLKLRKDPGYNRMTNSVRALTQSEIEFINENYLKYTNHALAKMMNRSEAAIQRHRKILGIVGKENTGRKKKGSVSWNKGKKMPTGYCTEAMKRTQFKKGQQPHNTKSDGHVSIRYSKGRPYVWIRLATSKWRELHRVVWEKTMGAIPNGYNVQFKDGNSTNCDPQNLYLINRENQMMQNTIHRYPQELKQVMRLVGKLKRKINQHEKQD